MRRTLALSVHRLHETRRHINKNLCYSQAVDWGVPDNSDQAGSFKYGSSVRIIDWIEIKTYTEKGFSFLGLLRMTRIHT